MTMRRLPGRGASSLTVGAHLAIVISVGWSAVAEDTRVVEIYTDGACSGNPGPGGWGVVLRYGEHVRELSGGDPGPTTNNRMELTAAIEALNALRPGAWVTMIGDSQYVLKGMTEWLPGWKARGWRTAQRKPVLNAELWQALEAAVAQHAAVRWTWVRGHNGHALNERADRIASEEASRARR